MKNSILEYLKKHPEGKTPTEIGMALGKSYNTASSSVNLPLKKLIEEGFVIKEKTNGKTTYRYFGEVKLILEKRGVGEYTTIGDIKPNTTYIVDGNNLTITEKDE